MQNVPWQRAIRAVETRENVLISFFDRTSEREDNYHWLIELMTIKNSLVARNETPFIGMDKSEILTSEGRAVCIMLTTNCNSLRAFGFREDQIWEVSDHSSGALAPLVHRGRADYFAVDLTKHDQELEKHGFGNEDFTELFTLNTTTSYLAASKNIHPKILDRLLKSLE